VMDTLISISQLPIPFRHLILTVAQFPLFSDSYLKWSCLPPTEAGFFRF
jgi:hypothetical protein